MRDRGVVLKEGREVACSCPCHVIPMLHFMACCEAPKTEEGRMSLNAVVILEGILATYGGRSAQLATWKTENPDLTDIAEQLVADWKKGRL